MCGPDCVCLRVLDPPPPQVVADLDAANAAQLEVIKGEWERLVTETEARNRKKLEVLAR